MEARFGLIFLVCVSVTIPGYDISEKCTKQYDLSFTLKGYSCMIHGVGMYFYKDKQELDTIYFNYLPVGAGIFIDVDSHVKTISIGEGDLSVCPNVHTPSGVVVLVNSQECVTNSVGMSSSLTPARDSTASSSTETKTSSSMETKTSSTMETKTSSSMETKTSSSMETLGKLPSHIKGAADIDMTEVAIYSSVVAVFVIISILICICRWCKRRRTRELEETGRRDTDSVVHFEMRPYHEHEHVL